MDPLIGKDLERDYAQTVAGECTQDNNDQYPAGAIDAVLLLVFQGLSSHSLNHNIWRDGWQGESTLQPFPFITTLNFKV